MTESRTKQRLSMPKLWRVIVHNEDGTPAPPQFLIALLAAIFYKEASEAKSLAATIQDKKRATVGTYPREVANQRVDRATAFCAQHGQHSVKITTEPTA
jgi:ATP-dependent Clp protease adapter protein ClpS